MKHAIDITLAGPTDVLDPNSVAHVGDLVIVSCIATIPEFPWGYTTYFGVQDVSAIAAGVPLFSLDR